MNVQGKKVLVVGLGGSGLAAAKFLVRRGALVTVTDIKPEEELREQANQLQGSVQFSLGGHQQTDFDNADFIILSPGVPASLPELRHAASKGVPLYSEVELAYRFLKGKIIGVTGSNGKTTTTALIGELFKNHGKPYVVAGNIAPSLALTQFIESSTEETTFVVELSSFQLETIDQFRCNVALLLNVTPDHLDRYTSFDDYVQAKERIFLNQTSGDYAIFNADNPYSAGMATRRCSRVMRFSRKHTLEDGVFVEDGKIRVHWKSEKRCLMPTGEIRLKGSHNLENVLAATAAGYVSDLDFEVMAETFHTFSGVEHRLEWVRRLRGVDFYNDSKATNVDSAYQALNAFSRPLIVIMGGKDKGGDFTVLRSVAAEKVKLLVLVGAASEKILGALGSTVPAVRTKDMNEAVKTAYRHGASGDVVLLSPGCASFDMFDNYEHRGRVFKEIVNSL